MPVPQELVDLSHRLGRPERELVILAEGNTSCKTGETFWVKSSGHQMATIAADGFVECQFGGLVKALDESLTDKGVHDILLSARIGEGAKPSVEAFMHAWLLTLPEVTWVGHVHPTAALALLCRPSAESYCDKRHFPDEVVCCGVATAWVPYVDPGIELARQIRASITKFIEKYAEAPKVIWLQNHGTIALGKTATEVESALLMNDKACRVINVSTASGVRPVPMTAAHIERIHSRPDEHYRQKLLWQLTNKS